MNAITTTSASPFDLVVDKLDVAHRNGSSATARCPVHDDGTASLSITEGDDGKVLLHCHAGCTVNAITEAVGLTVKDLFPKTKTNGHSQRRIVATYEYTDENSEPLFQVVKFEPKDFRQRRSNGRGGWEWSIKGTRRVLYRLPAVIRAVEAGETVYVVEGEKDVEALEQLGVVATCNPQGAGKWTSVPDAGQVLAGATVIVVADRDEPGRRHATEVAIDLRAHGCIVFVREPPEGHKDVADLLGAGGTLDDLVIVPTDSAPRSPTWNGEPGHIVLDAVHAELTRYVAFPSSESADAAALFVVASHAQPAWEHATRLVVKSPQKRCGKTRFQETAGELVHRPLRTTNISVAALVRSIDEVEPPTIMLDEADSIFVTRRGERSEGAEDLRGILNTGHARGWPYLRWNMNTNQTDECPTFAMAVIAGIGDLPDTIEDRAVVISMRRRAPGERVAPWRRRKVLPELHAVRERIHAWARHHLDQLAEAEPAMPVEDRAADVWEPLIAVADLAGDDWPDRARVACKTLTNTVDTEADVGERLLGDLHDVIDGHRLTTETILERLNGLSEAPWPTWYRGQPLSARSLAKLLRPYGIKSTTFRVGDTTPKGYHRADFADAWTRYLGLDPQQAQQAQHPYEPPDDDRCGYVADSEIGIRNMATQELFGDVADVADVADEGANNACDRCGEPLNDIGCCPDFKCVGSFI